MSDQPRYIRFNRGRQHHQFARLMSWNAQTYLVAVCGAYALTDQIADDRTGERPERCCNRCDEILEELRTRP